MEPLSSNLASSQTSLCPVEVRILTQDLARLTRTFESQSQYILAHECRIATRQIVESQKTKVPLSRAFRQNVRARIHDQTKFVKTKRLI